MKKQILFVIKDMAMGGSRKSLLNLLSVLSLEESLNISILILSPSGPLIKEIPNCVTQIRSNMILDSLFSNKRDLSIWGWIIRIVFSFLRRIFGYNFVYHIVYQQFIDKTFLSLFDTVVGFQEGESDDFSMMIPGHNHIVWFHCDYEKYLVLEKKEKIIIDYSRADYLAFVTTASMVKFAEINPELSNRILLIKNVINESDIKNKMCELTCPIFTSNGIHLISIGRISEEKAFERVIEVAVELIARGVLFEWVIIGDGKNLNRLRENVSEKALDQYVHFIGRKNNPYSMLKQADLFVLTSKYEAQPLVLIESLIIGIPVISTDFDSVREVIPKGAKYGIVTENSSQGLYNGILHIVEDCKLEGMKTAVNGYHYENQEIISIVRQIL